MTSAPGAERELATGRIPGLDGLRAIAAGAILLSHVWLYAAPDGARVDLGALSRFAFPHLGVGLTLFFALSGFLLWRPQARDVLGGTRRLDVGRYWRNRLLRILPAYWFILLATGVVLSAALVPGDGGVAVLGSLRDHPQSLVLSLLLLQNLHPEHVLAGIGPAWSLAVELVFYLSVPLLAALSWMLAGRGPSAGEPVSTATAGPPSTRRLLAALSPALLLLVLGLTTRLALGALGTPNGPSPGWDQSWYSVVARSFPAHAAAFAPGMALAVLSARMSWTGGVLRPWPRRALLGGAALGAVATAAAHQVGLVPSIAYELGLAIACTALIAAVALPHGMRALPRLTSVLELRPVVAAGVASYSVYLWHEPLIRWMSARGLTAFGTAGFVRNLLVAVGLTGVLAALTYRFVERPAMLLAARPRAVGPVPPPAPRVARP